MSVANSMINIIITLLPGALGPWRYVPTYPVMLQSFPLQHRYSGIAFSFNIGLAIFSITALIISAFLAKTTELLYAPSFYLIISLELLYSSCYFWNSRNFVIIKKEIYLSNYRVNYYA